MAQVPGPSVPETSSDSDTSQTDPVSSSEAFITQFIGQPDGSSPPVLTVTYGNGTVRRVAVADNLRHHVKLSDRAEETTEVMKEVIRLASQRITSSIRSGDLIVQGGRDCAKFITTRSSANVPVVDGGAGILYYSSDRRRLSGSVSGTINTCLGEIVSVHLTHGTTDKTNRENNVVLLANTFYWLGDKCEYDDLTDILSRPECQPARGMDLSGAKCTENDFLIPHRVVVENGILPKESIGLSIAARTWIYFTVERIVYIGPEQPCKLYCPIKDKGLARGGSCDCVINVPSDVSVLSVDIGFLHGVECRVMGYISDPYEDCLNKKSLRKLRKIAPLLNGARAWSARARLLQDSGLSMIDLAKAVLYHSEGLFHVQSSETTSAARWCSTNRTALQWVPQIPYMLSLTSIYRNRPHTRWGMPLDLTAGRERGPVSISWRACPIPDYFSSSLAACNNVESRLWFHRLCDTGSPSLSKVEVDHTTT